MTEMVNIHDAKTQLSRLLIPNISAQNCFSYSKTGLSPGSAEFDTPPAE